MAVARLLPVPSPGLIQSSEVPRRLPHAGRLLVPASFFYPCPIGSMQGCLVFVENER